MLSLTFRIADFGLGIDCRLVRNESAIRNPQLSYFVLGT